MEGRTDSVVVLNQSSRLLIIYLHASRDCVFRANAF